MILVHPGDGAEPGTAVACGMILVGPPRSGRAHRLSSWSLVTRRLGWRVLSGWDLGPDGVGLSALINAGQGRSSWQGWVACGAARCTGDFPEAGQFFPGEGSG